MPDLTPEKLAELRRLLAANETPWALWDGYGPDGRGDMRVERIGHLSGSGIQTDPDSADMYGPRETFELLVSAVNALPGLLSAATERDALRAKLDAVRDLAAKWATQPTDYDEDTEQQIADGRGILLALDGRAES